MRKRSRREHRGAVVVEFALIMPIFLLLVFGIIQYGIYFFSMQAGTNAAGEAIRRMSVGDCQTSGSVQTLVFARLNGRATSAKTASGVTVTTSYTKADGSTAASSPGEIGGTVKVTISYPSVNLKIPFIPVPDNGTVTRTATARIEDVTAISGGCT